MRLRAKLDQPHLRYSEELKTTGVISLIVGVVMVLFGIDIGKWFVALGLAGSVAGGIWHSEYSSIFAKLDAIATEWKEKGWKYMAHFDVDYVETIDQERPT